MDVSIVIPTKNGGKEIESVLKAVFGQKTKYEYEVICVDSGSSDNTIEIIKKYPVKLYQIAPEEFGHGKTRNYGAGKGTGRYIVFLTQDALPADENWLENFINAMEEDVSVAGGFGKHYPYPDCNEIDKRDLKRHFQNFGQGNTVFKLDDWDRYMADKGYQQYLGFFSDNNSCLRRSVWEKIPYDDVNFAEDQIWARKIIEAGYKKLYCEDAIVYHSHNYELKTYFQRYYDEFKGIYRVYQWKMFTSFKQVIKHLYLANRIDADYINDDQNGIEDKKYWKKYAFKRNRYKCIAAYLAGKYESYPSMVKDFLDTHISQQYKQINVKKKRNTNMRNWRELLKWILFDPKYLESNAPLKELVRKNSNTCIGNIDPCGRFDFVTNKMGQASFSMEDYEKNKDSQITVNWVIPEPGIGSGGHINIFRFVTGLERLGIHNRIYLLYAGKFSSNKQCEEFLEKYYNIDCSDIEVCVNINEMKFAHATIATAWQTAYAVNRFNNTISKMYFVQDFEPWFYSVGSDYTFAENTYKFGFRGITAGDWLKDKLRDEYKMKTASFLFSYDDKLYVPCKKRDNKNRVFFYARPYTARRAFEFGIMALTELAKKVPDLEVVLAGEDVSQYKIEFNYVNAGIVGLTELADLYAQCNMCLVLSTTNLSLLPLEVMASNSVAVCTKGKNSEWLVNDENSIMVEFDIDDIVEKMTYYFNNKEELEKIRQKGMAYAKNTSWDNEVQKVYDFVVRSVREDEESISTRG